MSKLGTWALVPYALDIGELERSGASETWVWCGLPEGSKKAVAQSKWPTCITLGGHWSMWDQNSWSNSCLKMHGPRFGYETGCTKLDEYFSQGSTERILIGIILKTRLLLKSYVKVFCTDFLPRALRKFQNWEVQLLSIFVLWALLLATCYICIPFNKTPIKTYKIK